MTTPSVTERFTSLLKSRSEIASQSTAAQCEVNFHKSQDNHPDLEEWQAKADALQAEEDDLLAQMQALADTAVKDHPELFTHLAAYNSPDKHNDLVKIASAFSTLHVEDAVAIATIWELANFERQHIGATQNIIVRPPGGRT